MHNSPHFATKSALLSAIAHAGGQAALARKLSAALNAAVSQQRIWNAVHRDQTVPAEWCLAIEQATGGQVTRHALRPDLYPPVLSSEKSTA